MQKLPIRGRRLASSFLALMLVLALPAAIWSQTVGSGTITGRVSNAATRSNLEGAVVRLGSTDFSATTERDGTYRLQVPPGNYTLTASYIGLDDQNITLSVQAGAMVRQDIGLTSVVYQLDKFVVAGEREGNALALTIQRQLPNIKNVVNVFARADRAWEYWGGRPNGTEWMRPEFLFGLNYRL